MAGSRTKLNHLDLNLAMKAILISGTDTNAGKTVLTSALAAYWQTYRKQSRLGIIKLLQSGEGDRELYSRLFSLDQTLEELNPLYFQTPLAPPIAAAKEGKIVELGKAWQVFNQLCQKKDWVIAEGVGGLGSPITAELTVADLARDWHLPIILVVPVRLGAIAQAVANVALARYSKIQLKGIVLNCINPDAESQIADLTPVSLLESLTSTPVLGSLPYLSDPMDFSKLAEVAANLDLETLEMC